MSDTGESTTTPQLQEELESWLTDRVEGTDRTPGEELDRIVAVYRLATDGAGPGTDGTELGTDGENPPDLESIARLPDRLEETRAEFQQGIEDVRERVIQVLEETHDRAEKDHTHPEIDNSIADVTDRIEPLEESLADLEASLTELEESIDVEAQRQDMEALESDLAETTDRVDEFTTRFGAVEDRTGEIEGKLDRLASAVVGLRRRTDRLEARLETQDRLDALKREANRTGSRTADCGQCGRTVTVALLSAPRCPHCEAGFREIDPSRGFFGSATLLADDRPALEGETAPEADPGNDESDDRRGATARE
ncbi:Uncharacterized protein AArcCO_2083 [Halalkaliarchaeum sp. AArc-CO]|uniref:hypothetical protein n=1 Tax=unclassified Halalkaliarchaeum TaxID=2678344 RepID=UPI00217D62BB|nr:MULTISPECIES: hypothetical protein [unclassified Halalkaliarchaeum]MDR5671874.1 hypothetical protein [Halalkaliarchaeum sp. AArc-GB]UWG51379.1 Uncharacterized protein AArcCO_2083 [Halalkaliarchaeum sp. AArc-CO]